MNAKRNLEVQLPILAKLKGISYEVIIIDNNSTDGSKDYIRNNFSKMGLVELKENMGTAAINKGLRNAKGRYILYMGDMVLNEKTINSLRATLDNNPDIGIATPYIFNYFSKKVEFTGEIISRSLYSKSITKKIKGKQLIDLVGTGVGMIKRETIKDVGGFIFDPDYFLYGEDIDLGLRIRLIGKRSVIVPDAKIYHAHIPITTKTFSRFHLKFLTERNLTLTFLRTFSMHTIIILFPYLLFTRLLGCAKDLVSLNFQSFFGRTYGLAWLLLHPKFVLKKRKISQKIRKVKDSYIFKPFSEKAIFSL
jgi:GT2 family glycosyltransferase